MLRLGVVSYLNSRPLIDGLAADDLVLDFDVPARLSERLLIGQFDAALIPLADVIRNPGRLGVISDACIASDGETMTVRVFSQVPPDRIRTLHVDLDSHTSVALARILWQELYARELDLRPFETRTLLTDRPAPHDEIESVLLIGDKVVDSRRGSFAYEVDLGGAWRQLTGLPFVFAVWAMRISAPAPTCPESGAPQISAPSTAHSQLFARLAEARDRGVARAAEIARSQGPALGWTPAAADRYLTRCLKFTLDGRMLAGAELFASHCRKMGIAPRDSAIIWKANNLRPAAPEGNRH